MHGHSASIHNEMKRDSRSLLRQKPRADMEVGWLRCNQLMMATPLDFFSRQLATHEPVICTAHRRRWTTQHPQKCPRFSIFVTIPMSTSVQIWTPILRGKLYSNQPTGYEGRTTKVKQFCQCNEAFIANLQLNFACHLLLARYPGERNQPNASFVPVGLAWRTSSSCS